MFISPLMDDCAKHFIFHRNGEISGADEQGEYTVGLLNLNCTRLVNARRALYDECCRFAESGNYECIAQLYLDEQDEKLPQFVDMVQFFYDRGEFQALQDNTPLNIL